MDSFLQLFIFTMVMLFGSYMAGSVPLFMPMSENNLHLVSVMGAGLLVGVAFAVIVPEGMQTLIKAYHLKDDARNGKIYVACIRCETYIIFSGILGKFSSWYTQFCVFL